jgi:hypothetical protein
MSVEVDYFYADNIWQSSGTPVGWSWGPLGPQDGRFWMVTVIPEYANVGALSASGLSWNTDNNLMISANINVTIPTGVGALLGFKAIRVPSI